jgi:hypothetical protein
MYGRNHIMAGAAQMGQDYGAALGAAYQQAEKCPASAPASREVPEQMERLDKALYFAQESLQELLARLDPLTRPNAPETTANGCGVAPSPVATSYGGQLFGFGSRAGNLGERIQDLLRRLEV